MILEKAGLYFHTLRYLKPVQIWRRFIFRFWRPVPDLRPAPVLRAASGLWQGAAVREPSMLSPYRFRFLREEHEIAHPADWDVGVRAKLWTYNLHYFDDLNARGAQDRVGWHGPLMQRWIVENRPGLGTGWEPYPLSLRIVNWIKWALSGNPLEDAVRHSLAVQVRYLSHRLEHHLLGNHLFSNAKALVFAGCYFNGEEADRWLRRGMEILTREIPEQILADGGQFERSTMYHALAYEDMLDLANLASTYSSAFSPWRSRLDEWAEHVPRMGHWLAAMCHPDGEIAFFNDAALGIAPSPSNLFAYAERLGFARPADMTDGVTWLKASGYVRIQRAAAVLLIDVAPVGPDYLPGHAHADTLSFELSLGRQRVIVNSGTSLYEVGPQREWERSTAAHSTLEIDGQNSSEVWAGFRVARRAFPADVSVRQSADADVVSAAHDGYRRLAGRPMHRRAWLLAAGQLSVTDIIEGAYGTAVARY